MGAGVFSWLEQGGRVVRVRSDAPPEEIRAVMDTAPEDVLEFARRVAPWVVPTKPPTGYLRPDLYSQVMRG